MHILQNPETPVPSKTSWPNRKIIGDLITHRRLFFNFPNINFIEVKMYTLSFDGLFREKGKSTDTDNEAGIMCYGWLISEGTAIIAKGHGSYTHREVASSNGAEYLALIEGLEALKVLGLKNEPVLVKGDSKSVIDQMQGIAEVTSSRIKTLHRKAKRLSQKMAGLQWQWVPRQQNKAADQLTRHALRQVRRGRKETISTIGETKRSTGFHLISDLMICQRPAKLALNH
jgi:ribonuclease HI